MKPPSQAVRKHNRRAGEAQLRLGRVLKAANQEFLKNGYRQTSLDRILVASGGSKATLLKYFGNKAGLFGAVMEAVVVKFVNDLDASALQTDPEQALQWLGEAVLKFYLRADSLMAHRGVIAEGHVNPDMAHAFYENGYGRIVKMLANRLAEWQRSGVIHSSDPRGDAEHFLHGLRGGLYERALLGLGRAASKREITAKVQATVRIFLHGLR